MHYTQVEEAREHFHMKFEDGKFKKGTSKADVSAAPLRLNSTEYDPDQLITSIKEKAEKWENKTLQGKHPYQLSQKCIDKEASNKWPEQGKLYGETEVLMIAIKYQIVNTKNRLKCTLKDSTRKCNSQQETI